MYFSDIQENKIINTRINKDYIVTESSGIGNKLISRELIRNLRFPKKTKSEDLVFALSILADCKKIISLFGFCMDRLSHYQKNYVKSYDIHELNKKIVKILKFIRTS